MKTRNKIIIGIFVACLAVFQLTGCSDAREHRLQLYELQSQNQADTIFHSDSLQRELVRYFDRHGSSNERMLAHYLLGRAYADMGEAPQAIEAYQQAIEYADTTQSDCDLRTLRSIYGQMAYVFYSQNLPEKFIEAENKYIDLAWRRRDTIDAVVGIANLKRAYNLLNDTDMILQLTDSCTLLFQNYGRPDLAARNQCGATYFDIERHNYSKAKERIDLIHKDAGIFNDNGDLIPGCEDFYYTLGCYFNAVGQLDSAEYYFRKVLASNKNEEGYRGLLSVYDKRQISDSVRLFARLYADANDVRYREMNSNIVCQTSALYNYTRQKDLAQKQTARAGRFRLTLFCVLAIMLIAALFTLRYRQKNNEEKARLMARYSKAADELDAARHDLQILNQSISKDNAITKLLKEKEGLIAQLESTVRRLQEQIGLSQDIVQSRKVEESEIIQHFHLIAQHHCVNNNGTAQTEKPRAATTEEWAKLVEAVQQYHPMFYLFIVNRKLSALKFKVSILSFLGFDNHEITILTNANKGSIPNARTALAKELFGLSGAHELDDHLRQIEPPS